MPVEYYCKLPNDINEREVFVLDPDAGYRRQRLGRHRPDQEARCHYIKFIGLVAAPGVRRSELATRCGHLCRRTGRETER